MNTRILGNFCKFSLALTIAAISSITLPVQAALLVSSSGDNSIKQYDEITGEYIRDFVTSSSGGLLNPQGLTLGASGNLFVSSFGTNSVKQSPRTTTNTLCVCLYLVDPKIEPLRVVFGPIGFGEREGEI